MIKAWFKIYNLLFIFIPISIILGPTISLINIFINFNYLFRYFKIGHFKLISKNKTLFFFFFFTYI